MILLPLPAADAASAAPESPPELGYMPLPADLALHASPIVSLIVDFYFFEKRYPTEEAVYEGAMICAIAGIAYCSWVEWLAAHNGSCK